MKISSTYCVFSILIGINHNKIQQDKNSLNRDFMNEELEAQRVGLHKYCTAKCMAD